MTVMNFEQMSDRQMVVQFILEYRNKGLFLPYAEYFLIDNWLALVPRDTLIMVLSDVMPQYFEEKANRSQPPSLKGLNKLVLKRIKSHLLRSSSDKSTDSLAGFKESF